MEPRNGKVLTYNTIICYIYTYIPYITLHYIHTYNYIQVTRIFVALQSVPNLVPWALNLDRGKTDFEQTTTVQLSTLAECPMTNDTHKSDIYIYIISYVYIIIYWYIEYLKDFELWKHLSWIVISRPPLHSKALRCSSGIIRLRVCHRSDDGDLFDRLAWVAQKVSYQQCPWRKRNGAICTTIVCIYIYCLYIIYI